MLKKEKIKIGEDYLKKLGDSSATFLANYKGLKAEDLADFRRSLRKNGGEFGVSKNRVLKFSVEKYLSESAETKDKFNTLLKGPIGIVYLKGDVAEGAKSVVKFSKEKAGKFELHGGLIDGDYISVEDINRISLLPSKEILLTKIVGSIVSSHRGILSVLTGVQAKLVRTIAAIKDKKS